MAFEDITYETILNRCLARVPSDVDKREGAVIFDAIAPAAAELAILYMELSSFMDRVFPDTQVGDDLTKKVVERGLLRREASRAVRLAYFVNAQGAPFDPPVGARFSGGTANYAVTERVEAGKYKVLSETPGVIGNQYFGKLIPIDYFDGLASAVLADILIHGDDAEDDESLRSRYFDSLNNQSYGGNVADYKSKAKQMQGVGGVKVQAVWNGGGTVRLVLINSEWGVPSNTLIEDVQNAFDPIRGNGEGLGLAPIGHVVTVDPVRGLPVDIQFTLTFDGVLTWPDVESDVKAAIQAYFTDLARLWDEDESIVVRVSQIETRILVVSGVVDIQDTTINGTTSNILLDHDEIPILGAVVNGTS